MTEVHRTAARGFHLAADAYERARPSYPPAAVDAVLDGLEPGARILDLAAGTGKLTRLLVERGRDVVAVEPVEGMRARFVEALPGVEILDGTAEAIPLPDASVDLVVAAQAFHWFANDAALGEMHRVLRARGAVSLVWNVRDERTPWVARVTELIRPFEGSDGAKIPRHREMTWRAVIEGLPLFTYLGTVEVEHGQPMDVDGLVDRVASTSFIAVLPEDDRARVLDQVRALAGEFGLGGTFEFPYVCEVHRYTRTG